MSRRAPYFYRFRSPSWTSMWGRTLSISCAPEAGSRTGEPIVRSSRKHGLSGEGIELGRDPWTKRK